MARILVNKKQEDVKASIEELEIACIKTGSKNQNWRLAL